ncbi:MAG: DUF420 domain-containing protein [Pirellulales bacterium]|nr:DUF420 domain-containing protein [Pirellulales bacterium]
MIEFIRETFPSINAGLNTLALLLLINGFTLIRRGNVRAHRNVMLSAFGVSILFLTCYLTYHYVAGHVAFQLTGAVRTVYRFILFTHIVLAAIVPVLAIVTIVLGLKGRRVAHRRLARWTFPIWVYVSITGVIIYFMLYHLPGARG